MSVVTISAFSPGINWHWGGSTATLRYTYTSDFVDSTGTPILHGLYKDVPCTIAGGVISVPSHTVISTLDALVNPLVTLNAQYIDERGAKRAWQFQNFQVPTTTPTTMGALTIFNQGSSLVLPPDWYLNAIQVQNLINIALGTLNHMSDVVEGIGYSDVAPTVAIHPTLVGRNSPVIPEFTLHTSKYASYNLAVAAINSLGGGTVVVDSSTPVTAPISVPYTVVTQFQGQGQLTGASTVTFVGPLIAPPIHIFATGITASFLGTLTTAKLKTAWWGSGAGNSAAINATAFNAANAAMVTVGGGEIEVGPGTHDFNATFVLGDTGGAITGISLGGSNGLDGTVLRWTGSTSGTAIRISKGRFNHLHDFYLFNSVAAGTTNGILATGPAVDLQTAHVHIDRVTVDGFFAGYQAGELNTQPGVHSANDETLFTGGVFQNCTNGFYAVSNLNNLGFTFEMWVFANCTHGVHSTAGAPITLTGCEGGSNDVDLFIDGDRQPLTVNGWDGETSVRFIQATTGATVQVNTAILRAYTLTRVDRTAIIEVTGKTSLTNVFQSGNGTSAGATGPHFVYALNTGSVDITNCYFPDDELPHISPVSSESDTTAYRLWNNHSIDNTSNAILSKFPDEQGIVTWPRMSSGEVRLRTVIAVDMNTATPTLLFTCPFGRRCNITKVVIRNPDTSIGTASYSFGWNSAAFNDVIATATHAELTGPTLYTVLFPKVGARRGVAGDEFKVLMNTLNGVLSHTDMDVYGELN